MPSRARAVVTLVAAAGAFACSTTAPPAAPPAVVDRFVVSGVGASVRAGEALSLVVEARDAAGDLVPGYRGAVLLSTPGDPRSALPGAHAFTALDAGVHAFTGVALRTAGVQTLTVTETSGGGLTKSLSTTVVPAAPAQLTVGAQPGAGSVRAALLPALVVAVRDSFDNLVATATSTIAVRLSPAGGALGGTASLAPSGGLASFDALTVGNEGIGFTLVAESGSLTPATSAAFNVTDGLAPASPGALSAVAQGRSAISLAWTAPGDDGVLGPLVTPDAFNPPGFYRLCTRRGAAPAVCADGPQAGLPAPGAPGGVQTASVTGLAANATYQFTLSAIDGAGNASQPATAVSTTEPCSTGQAGDDCTQCAPGFHRDGQNACVDACTAPNPCTAPPAASCSADTLSTFPATGLCSLVVPGVTECAYPPTTTDCAALGKACVQGACVEGPPSFVLTAPATATAGAPLQATLEARNPLNQPLTSYRGTVRFTSSDGLATLPADYTFTAADSASHTFDLTLRTAGPTARTVTVTVTDTAAPASTATRSVAVSPGAAAQLFFAQQPTAVNVRTALAPPVQVSVLDAEGNVVTNATGTVSLALGNNPGFGLLAGTPSQPLSSGVAVFSGLSLTNEGAATLVASKGVGLTRTSDPFTVTDQLAPAPVTDFLATPLGPTSVALDWSAPGDDGLLGELAPASGPKGRYLVCSKVQGGTQSCQATPDGGVPVPSPPGSPEGLVVGSLLADTSYVFELQVFDGAGNKTAAFATATTDPASGPLTTAPGDTCETAASLAGADAVVESTTAGLANDYTTTGTGCSSATNVDGVYRIEVPDGSRLTATVVGMGALTYDPSISLGLSPAACTNSNRVCVAGDDSGSASTINAVVYSNTTGSAQTLFIFIDGGGSVPGPFRLTTSLRSIPAGDRCETAVAIPAPGTITGSLTASFFNDFTSAGTGCGSVAGLDRVYRLDVPAAQRLTATVAGAAGFKPSIAIGFEQGSCTNTGRVCIASADVGAATPGVVTYANDNPTAQTIFLFIDSATAASAGDFTLTTAFDAAPAQQPGESCFSATPITTAGTDPTVLSGTTIGFANDYSGGTGCAAPRTSSATYGLDRVYSVAVPAGQRVTAVLTPQASFNPLVELVVGPAANCEPRPRSCAVSASLAGNGGVETARYTNLGSAEQTVFIIIDSTTTTVAAQSGTFGLSVALDTPP